jgi:hypothetical protein
MSKYTAQVSFAIHEFEASSTRDAMEKVNQLFDQLAEVNTDLTWDDVDYIVQEEN